MAKPNLGLALLAGAGTLAFTWTANAQTAAEAELTEVVITGSRVITNGNDSPTPITVVSVEDIQAAHPASVYEGLLDMPQLGGSKGTAAANPGGAGGNNNNINAPNLRGLGGTRTLVLYDGHRMPPTEQDFLADANMIPQMLLQRIDVVTGGASAVYGSDAISGVVNFVTDRKFNGIKAQARYGIAEAGDDESYNIGVAFGTDLFGGRGHFEGSIETSDDAGIPHRTDRSNFVPRWTAQGSCASATNCPVPFYMAAYANAGQFAFGGKIVSGPVGINNYYFKSNGTLVPFVNGAPTGVANDTKQIGGDGAYNTGASLKSPLNYQQAYGRFDFDLTDNTHFFLSTSATQSTQTSSFSDSRVQLRLSPTNAYLPTAVSQQMVAANLTQFSFNKWWGGNNPDGASPVPTQNATLDVDFLYVTTGLEGSLGDYKWEAAYIYGDAKQHSRQNANINYGRFLAATDAVKDSSGNIVCNVTITNPGLYPGCVPVNLFGPTSESQAAIDYFMAKTNYHTENQSNDVAASISGAPFDDWAGPVDMALSGDWRKLTYELTSEALPPTVAALDCTGLRFGNCTTGSTGQWLVGATAPRPPVSETVQEAALEMNMPLLKDKPWAQAADLNGAVRYVKYSINGNPIVSQPAITRTFNATVWKAGLNWHFNDEVTLRASRSHDFRAPNLDELFRPASITPNNGFQDYLIGGIPPNSVVQTSGNPNLNPENAYTTTLGFVFQPSPDFSAAIDGYEIRVKDFIPSGPNGVSGTAQNIQEACNTSAGTSPYCALIVRPITDPSNPAYKTTANYATKFYSTYINVAEQHTYGVDLELNYKTELASHPFSARGLVAYQPHVIYVQQGVNTIDAAGTINGGGAGPVGGVVRISAFLRYAVTDNLTVDWLTRWRTGLEHNTDPTLKVQDPIPYSPATAWSNLNLSYRINPSFGQMDIYFNVQNLFNQLPHPVAFSGASAEPGLFGGLALGDDVVGRYYTLGMRLKM